MRKTPYADLILAVAPDYDPRHIEAFMRIMSGTLDHLSPSQFRTEVRAAATCVDAGGPDFAERVARSYGF